MESQIDKIFKGYKDGVLTCHEAIKKLNMLDNNFNYEQIYDYIILIHKDEISSTEKIKAVHIRIGKIMRGA